MLKLCILIVFLDIQINASDKIFTTQKMVYI